MAIDVGGGFVTAAAFSRRNSQAVAAIARGSEHLVGVIDRSTGALASPLTVPGWTRVLSFSSDGALLAAGGQFDRIMIWDMSQQLPRLRTEIALQSVLQANMAVTALAFGPGNRAIAVGAENGLVAVLDVSTGSGLGDVITGEPPAWLTFLPVANKRAIVYPGSDGAAGLRSEANVN